MLISEIDKIIVYLIADHDHMVAQADLSQLLQFLYRPHSAYRVVRIAQNEEFYMFLFYLAFKVLEINLICRTDSTNVVNLLFGSIICRC